jgi:phosphate transport system substrate-binding protein
MARAKQPIVLGVAMTGATVLCAAGVALLVSSPQPAQALAASEAREVRLQGAGATFPAPLYDRWVAVFKDRNSNALISYQANGSGGGIKAITDRTVAFAGSDAPMTRRELEAVGGADKVLQFPSTAGGVVPAYNLPGFKGEVNFTGPILADIYLGKIARWNDERLREVNPGVALPDMAITPAYRTDSSGTTFVFSTFLASHSEELKGSVGAGKKVNWPQGVGQGGKGNAGVAAIVQQSPGALGYIEQNFASANSIAYGAVQNAAGKFVKASPESISAAAAAATAGGEDLVADIWNAEGEGSYPISAFSYIIVYRDMSSVSSKGEAQLLMDFFAWSLDEGQDVASQQEYAPLPEELRGRVRKALSALTYKGEALSLRATPGSEKGGR